MNDRLQRYGREVGRSRHTADEKIVVAANLTVWQEPLLPDPSILHCHPDPRGISWND